MYPNWDICSGNSRASWERGGSLYRHVQAAIYINSNYIVAHVLGFAFGYVQTSVAFTSLVVAAVPTLYVSCQKLCLILHYRLMAYWIWISKLEGTSKQIVASNESFFFFKSSNLIFIVCGAGMWLCIFVYVCLCYFRDIGDSTMASVLQSISL